MNVCRSVWGVTALPIPARRAVRAHDPPGAVPVQPLPVRSQEYRAVRALPDGQVDRPGGPRRQRDSHHLFMMVSCDMG